ncbi:MAG: cadherin repeat domain-containing protein [Deltaproteobacteria bacterium]|nr:cadherin repeat domain-containing protein [Deltaproteobacteria bacterium]
MRRSLPLLLLLSLVFACSGDRKAPTSAPSPAGNGIAPTAQQGGGAPVGGEPAPPPDAAVRNASPEIRGVRFVGGDGRPGNTLGVETEGYDADGDAVQFEIAWQKNGQPAGTGNRLTAPVKRGDKVTVTVTPFDGKERGKSATLFREILNTPPVIEGQEQFQVTENAVTFHVRASDADGDPLTFSLKDAPAGMSIDRKTGWVRWVTSPGTTGKVPFTVIVSDGAGGESTARFSVTIAQEPAPGAGPR